MRTGNAFALPLPGGISVVLSLLLAATGLAAVCGMAAGGTPDKEDAEVKTIAVLEFEAKDVSEATARGASESLRDYLKATGEFTVFDRQDAESAYTEALGGIRARSVCNEVSCAVKIGKILKAGSVVIGSVSEFGRLLTVSARIVNVYSGEVTEELIGESFEGEENLPEAITQIIGRFELIKAKLPSGHKPFPEDLARARAQRSAQYETSLKLGAGLGLQGQDSSTEVCDPQGTAVVCVNRSAELRWLVDVSMCARLTDSRWVFGLRGGASSVETAWRIDYEDVWEEESEEGSDSGLHFHLYPQVGYSLHESHNHRVTVFAGAGYREFSDDSGVDKIFAATGVATRILMLRADVTYWHGFDSESVLRQLVTLDVGIGSGF